MNLTNAQVALTYKLRGAQLLLGEYLFREKVQGKILPKAVQFRTIKMPTYAKCVQTITLPESFVNFAISFKGRPYRNKYFYAYNHWKQMTNEQRLDFHIISYVNDIGGTNHFYDILI